MKIIVFYSACSIFLALVAPIDGELFKTFMKKMKAILKYYLKMEFTFNNVEKVRVNDNDYYPLSQSNISKRHNGHEGFELLSRGETSL